MDLMLEAAEIESRKADLIYTSALQMHMLNSVYGDDSYLEAVEEGRVESVRKKRNLISKIKDFISKTIRKFRESRIANNAKRYVAKPFIKAFDLLKKVSGVICRAIVNFAKKHKKLVISAGILGSLKLAYELVMNKKVRNSDEYKEVEAGWLKTSMDQIDEMCADVDKGLEILEKFRDGEDVDLKNTDTVAFKAMNMLTNIDSKIANAFGTSLLRPSDAVKNKLAKKASRKMADAEVLGRGYASRKFGVGDDDFDDSAW